MKKIVTLLALLGSLSLFSAEKTVQIVATNSWTAAFAKMAGLDAEVLAPSDMTHPPEYELRPSDLKKIKNADFLIFGGYEVMMSTVFESLDKESEQMVQVTTSYDPDTVEASVLAIAKKAGTVDVAKRNIAAYRAAITKGQQELKDAGLSGKTVIVNFHQKPLAEALGFKVLGVFGPQPLSAKQIGELGKTSPSMIIDNVHNPIAAPLEEILKLDAVVLVNFPGYTDERGKQWPGTLQGVAEENIKILLEGK